MSSRYRPRNDLAEFRLQLKVVTKSTDFQVNSRRIRGSFFFLSHYKKRNLITLVRLDLTKNTFEVYSMDLLTNQIHTSNFTYLEFNGLTTSVCITQISYKPPSRVPLGFLAQSAALSSFRIIPRVRAEWNEIGWSSAAVSLFLQHGTHLNFT